ncbi:MAG: hypothetical protein R6W72_02125 [Desulfurivibrionaceae bacterium]
MGEFEKKPFEWGGYLELKFEHSDLNQDGVLYSASFHNDRRSTLDRFATTLQLDGSYAKGIASFNWLGQATARQDDISWDDKADIFEAYASIKPTPVATVDLGKKVFRWGKGYAWNPAGFIARPKDPLNPEEALEGYVGAGLDLVKSFSGPLRTAALTTVVLPVWPGVNEDFGEVNQTNLAAKLYLLYRDTDFDFIWYSGDSRPAGYGMDFSRNVTPNFEIHGELAHVPKQETMALAADGSIAPRKRADTSYLLGLRYLTKNELTTIIEFYHNDDGYTGAELDLYYQLLVDAEKLFSDSGDQTLFRKAAAAGLNGYRKPQPGRNYLYVKFSLKEPYDLLYFIPGATAIVNLDDNSYSLSPEAVYTGFTNWEMRLRFSIINGGVFTENGEKQNSNKLELRVRYFF